MFISGSLRVFGWFSIVVAVLVALIGLAGGAVGLAVGLSIGLGSAVSGLVLLALASIVEDLHTVAQGRAERLPYSNRPSPGQSASSAPPALPSMSTRCPQCEAKNPAGAKFCHSCGTPL